MAETLKLEIVTPQATVFSEDVEMVTLPGADGQIGVYPQHVRLITPIVPGEIIVTREGTESYLMVGGGLVEVSPTRVSIVTDMAIPAEHIDEAKVEEARARAAARLEDKNLGRGSRLGKRLARAVARPAPGEKAPQDVNVKTLTSASRHLGETDATALAALRAGAPACDGPDRSRCPVRVAVGGSRRRSTPMTQTTSGTIAACLAVLVLSLPSPVAGQARQGGSPTATATDQQDPEAGQEPPAPVLIEDVPIIWVPTGVGPYSAQARAERITRRVEEVIRDRSIRDLTVTVTEAQGSSELRVGTRLLMVVTQNDAAVLGVSRASLAQQFSTEFQTALQRERLRYAPGTLIRSAAYAFVATMLFILAVWITRRLTRALHRVILRGVEARSESLRAIQAEMLADDRIGRGLTAAMRALRVVVVVLLLDLYLTYVLGLFPWTSALGRRLLPFAITPLMAVVRAFVGTSRTSCSWSSSPPSFYVAIKLVGLFFRQIELGRIVFPNFPAEWADPTNKIVRVLLIAFGLVVAFPYLPASNSPAFAGVSVFIGVLFSLASSSALSNMIAGIVLTYTGAFRVGDRVKVGDAFGDIIETSLLVDARPHHQEREHHDPERDRARNRGHELQPEASTLGLILHTSVTIGYDAPWRKIHDLLIAAALRHTRRARRARPFVWQTALNDFYVTYEINAYTNDAQTMHAHLRRSARAHPGHASTQAGVEIMSPHFTSLRDGNTIAIPEASRPADYRAPSFRVQDTTAAGVGLPDIPGITKRSVIGAAANHANAVVVNSHARHPALAWRGMHRRSDADSVGVGAGADPPGWRRTLPN